MTDLEDTFGADFAQNIKEKTAERREERNRVTDEQMAEICHLAVNENKFDDGDPQFTYKTDSGVTHNVLLMQLPAMENSSKEVWDFLDEPWDGAASIPFDYLGEWMRCTFPNEEQKKLLQKVNKGDWAIVVGSIDTYEKDNGDVIESVQPVRGLATLDEAKEIASKMMEEEGFSTDSEEDEEEDDSPSQFASGDDEDEEEDEAEEEEEEEDSSSSMFGSSDDDEEEESSDSGLSGLINNDEEEEEEEEEPVPYEEVAGFIENLMEEQDESEEPQIVDITRDMDHFDRLVEITASNLDLEGSEDGVADVIDDVLEQHRSDDDEEEEDEDDLTGNIF